MRYFPHTEKDIQQMLEATGRKSLSELFDSIPKTLRLSRSLDLPKALDEIALQRHLKGLSEKNTGTAEQAALFIGAGAYYHHIPAAVDHLIGRGEFLTAYTPYQPEVSQGTLQAIFEYQSMMASLTGTEVVNASMYDGATASAEALLMALRIVKKRKRIILSSGLHAEVRLVCQTYLDELGLTLETAPIDAHGQTDLQQLQGMLDDRVAAVMIQYPNQFGCVEDLGQLEQTIHGVGAKLCVVVLEPIALGLLEAPGRLGADIVAGEGMGLGTGLNYGGPGLGIFGTSNEHVWQMPGRLVGQTFDHTGKRGFVLTLSTREQHIRRARATSNICTNEGLCALAAAIHLSLLGEQGFHELALINAANARYAADRLTRHPKIERVFDAPFFNEFAIRTPMPAQALVQKLGQHGILGGFPLGLVQPELSHCLLVCVTEMNTKEQVEQYASVLESLVG